MRAGAIGLAILASLAARSGCEGPSAGPSALPARAVQREPTAERPIVVAFDEPDTLLIFGGPDGTLRERLPQPKGFLHYAFAPDGKSAAVCAARVDGVAVTVYDPSGTPVVEAAVRRKPEGPPSARMWLSNRRETLIHVSDMPVEAVPARQAGPVDPGWRPPPPRNPQTYFIRPDGAVVALGDLDPQEACFPAGAPGVAILSGQGRDPNEPAPRFVLTRLGGDLETVWRREIPTGGAYAHLWWHSQANLPPGVDLALDMAGEWWDFRADGLAARRPRSPVAWCAATRQVGHPTLDGRTVKLAISTQAGSPLRTVELADISTDWFQAAVWLGAGGHTVAAVWEVEYPQWGWPPPEPKRRYAGTWCAESSGCRMRLDVPAPIAGGVWADGSYALLSEEQDAFALRAWDAKHQPTWRRTWPKTTADGRPVRRMNLIMDAAGIVTVQRWDGERVRDAARLSAAGRVLPAG